MNPPPFIAKNHSLKENLFVMLVCILNKIPLFLTGPPGSSKTLALNLLVKSLRGKLS
jgi:MoxR-like ATPase